jgi:hypothetical protein
MMSMSQPNNVGGGGGAGFLDEGGKNKSVEGSERVKVIVRTRPLSEKEKAQGHES